MIEPLRYSTEVNLPLPLQRPVFCGNCFTKRDKRNNPNYATKFCTHCTNKSRLFFCNQCDEEFHRVGPTQFHVRCLLVIGAGVRKKVMKRGDGVYFPLPMDVVDISLQCKVYHEGKMIKSLEPTEMNYMVGLSGKTVHVQVLGARNIMAADSTGSSDPYIVALFQGKQLGVTRVRKRTLNPRWSNESFIVPLADNLPDTRNMARSQKGLFRLELYDYDTFGSNDFLGNFEISKNLLNKIALHAKAEPVVFPWTMKEFHGIMGLQIGVSKYHVSVRIVRTESIDKVRPYGDGKPYVKVFFGKEYLGCTPWMLDKGVVEWENDGTNEFLLPINVLLKRERILLKHKMAREAKLLAKVDASVASNRSKKNTGGGIKGGTMLEDSVLTGDSQVIDLTEDLKDEDEKKPNELFKFEIYEHNYMKGGTFLGDVSFPVEDLRIVCPYLPRRIIDERTEPFDKAVDMKRLSLNTKGCFAGKDIGQIEEDIDDGDNEFWVRMFGEPEFDEFGRMRPSTSGSFMSGDINQGDPLMRQLESRGSSQTMPSGRNSRPDSALQVALAQSDQAKKGFLTKANLENADRSLDMGDFKSVDLDQHQSIVDDFKHQLPGSLVLGGEDSVDLDGGSQSIVHFADGLDAFGSSVTAGESGMELSPMAGGLLEGSMTEGGLMEGSMTSGIDATDSVVVVDEKPQWREAMPSPDRIEQEAISNRLNELDSQDRESRAQRRRFRRLDASENDDVGSVFRFPATEQSDNPDTEPLLGHLTRSEGDPIRDGLPGDSVVEGNAEDEEGYEPLGSNMVSKETIVEPDEKQKAAIDKTARLVAKNGKDFKDKILISDQGKSEKFFFLKEGDVLNAYFEAKVAEYMAIAAAEKMNLISEQAKEENHASNEAATADDTHSVKSATNGKSGKSTRSTTIKGSGRGSPTSSLKSGLEQEEDEERKEADDEYNELDGQVSIEESEKDEGPPRDTSNAFDFGNLRHYPVHKDSDKNGASDVDDDTELGQVILRLLTASRGNVIQGLDEGVRHMSLGETARIKVRFDHAYNNFAMTDYLPARANLILTVKLRTINGFGLLGLPMLYAKRLYRFTTFACRTASSCVLACYKDAQKKKRVISCFRYLMSLCAKKKQEVIEYESDGESYYSEAVSSEEEEEEEQVREVIQVAPRMRKLITPQVTLGSKYFWAYKPKAPPKKKKKKKKGQQEDLQIPHAHLYEGLVGGSLGNIEEDEEEDEEEGVVEEGKEGSQGEGEEGAEQGTEEEEQGREDGEQEGDGSRSPDLKEGTNDEGSATLAEGQAPLDPPASMAPPGESIYADIKGDNAQENISTKSSSQRPGPPI
jgi:hypothetical protein